jgi:transcription antitermination factor NusG
LRSGEKVLIRKGPLEGIAGIVDRQKNSTRIVLTLDLIMKSISVEVDSEDLEVISHDPGLRRYSPSLVSSNERAIA